MVYPSFEELEKLESNNNNGNQEKEKKTEEVDILAQFDFQLINYYFFNKER